MDINNLSCLIQNTNELEQKSNDLDARWEQEGGLFAHEDLWDKAYQDYWDYVNTLAEFIGTNIPDIDRGTAVQMALHKREELTVILSAGKPPPES